MVLSLLVLSWKQKMYAFFTVIFCFFLPAIAITLVIYNGHLVTSLIPPAVGLTPAAGTARAYGGNTYNDSSNSRDNINMDFLHNV